MGKPLDAFHLIRGRLPEYCSKLAAIPSCLFWIHETVLSDYLGLPRGSNSVQGQSEALTALLHCIKEGGGGNRRRGTWVSTGIPHADLKMSNNALGNISYVSVRGQESFPRGDLSTEPRIRPARWFNFGATITADEQLRIARE